MSRTLGYLVQRVMEKLDLDPINSLNDSPDALLIAREAEDTYYDLINRNEWPERYDLINVESVGDTANPTTLRLSDSTLNIQSLRYNVTTADDTDTVWRELIQLAPEDFLDKVYGRKDSETTVTTASYKGLELYVYNDTMPTYFTVFDNEYLVLDSWDSTIESTVQGVKSVCRGSTVPTFETTDEYVIPVDITTFPLYLAEVTAAASIALNGTNDPESERRRNRGISRLRRSSFRTGTQSTRNAFGRVGNGRS